MQDIVFEDRYEFVAPHRGTWWPRVLGRFVAWRLCRSHKISSIDIRGIDHLKSSMEAGHGIIVAPNHCRIRDAAVVAELTLRVGFPMFAMASWNVFKVSWLQTFLIRRLGTFSIYREGMDRAALNCAIGILATAERPLVVFPEGVISRTNDRLSVLQEGVSMMACSAARKRAAANSDDKVVIHPLAVKYRFDGEMESSVERVLGEIESRLSWQSQARRPLLERIERVGQALLSLKEVEYLGAAQSGSIFTRRDRLIDTVLGPLEDEWCGGRGDGDPVARVKRLRTAILPEMVEQELSEEERQRRWRQLADCYLAQQMSLYPIDYIGPQRPVERILETVERFEEDLTDVATMHGPMAVLVEVGEAIEVPTRRSRNGEEDPLMLELEQRLGGMLEGLASEIDQSRCESGSKERS